EPIGHGLCRFHLGRAMTADGVSVLTRMVCRAAEGPHRGEAAGQAALAALAEAPGGPRGMGEWLSLWRRDGCPPVHHGAAFRRAYAPHYRVIWQKDGH